MREPDAEKQLTAPRPSPGFGRLAWDRSDPRNKLSIGDRDLPIAGVPLRSVLSASTMVRIERFGGPLAWYHRAFLLLFRPLRWVLRVRVEGAERIPKKGPLVLIAPHLAFIDPFPYLYVSLSRPPRFLAAAFFVLSSRALSFFMYLGGVIPVWRHRPDPSGARKALRVLSRGELLAFFPEGGRTWTAVPTVAMASAAKLLARVKAPVYVAAIEGAYDLWPRWDPKFRLRPIRVRFSGPIEFPAGVLRQKSSASGRRRRWWSDVYESGGKVDLPKVQKAIQAALAAAAEHEPRGLNLLREGRMDALPRLLCFCPACSERSPRIEGKELVCASCGSRWIAAPGGMLLRVAPRRETQPRPLEEIFLDMQKNLRARVRRTFVLEEPVEVLEATEEMLSEGKPVFVTGRARLSRREMAVEAGARRWSVPPRAAARGSIEGAEVLEAHAGGKTLQLRAPGGAFRLHLAARAILGMPVELLPP